MLKAILVFYFAVEMFCATTDDKVSTMTTLGFQCAESVADRHYRGGATSALTWHRLITVIILLSRRQLRAMVHSNEETEIKNKFT